ncbi:hypothetical protein Tsubulata_023374 [Turnera subulata]|uniref:Beta-glucosidase n=1 Tax=Turnera subulata TaxID=218843 RepID=A0A9Q0J452_9ROSI|nr:hypothetical protein Tsubulata_023374 [Turnera subulata]
MGVQKSLVLGMQALLVLACLLALTKPTSAACNVNWEDEPDFNPKDFPDNFTYGSAVSAYQVEGAASEYGRGPSIWDTLTHKYPGAIADKSNGDVAIDFYHRYEDDLKAMNDTGLKAFRFSISWSRLIPTGNIADGVNEEGIEFYNSLINTSIALGLEPFVTIFHWDTPQGLEDSYGGFLSEKIVRDYMDYTNLCFQRFGDRVKKWITLNEPWAYAYYGYDTGEFAPGRCSPWGSCVNQTGNSATEPYIVTHNMLLAHAAAVQQYREQYVSTDATLASQNGSIGITLCTYWMEPFNSSDTSDIEAAKRALAFNYGWYMDPLTYGRYPASMVEYVGGRLPNFTTAESEMIKGSYDFIGLNYYTSRYVKYDNESFIDAEHMSYSTDAQGDQLYSNASGHCIGPEAGLVWLRVYPYGIRALLNETKNAYKDPVIYVTENGMAHEDNPLDTCDSASIDEIIYDTERINYYNAHLGYVGLALNEDKVDVRGYFAWSFFDNFEWSSGYTQRFGLTYINYTDNLARVPKASRIWFRSKLTNPQNSKVSEPKWSRPYGAM